MASEKFCLKWNDFERNISSAFKDIREEKEFFDITLACEDDQLQAHKVILSACSPFFKNVLRRNPHQHPLLYLKGVSYRDMQAVLNFMYHGEVNVAQDELNSFLQVAEDLRVKGLTQNNSSSNSASHPSSSPAAAKASKSEQLRTSRHSEADGQPPAKRSRPRSPPPLPSSRQQAGGGRTGANHDEDDDIQEVLPVKSEPVVGGGGLVDPSGGGGGVSGGGGGGGGGGTMAMYDDDGTGGEEGDMSGGMLMENYDDSYQEYDDGGDYGDQNYGGVGGAGQDAGTGSVTCPFCPKTMYRRNLSRHITVKHTDLQPSLCTICNKSMKSEWSLKEHERKYHGILQSQKEMA